MWRDPENHRHTVRITDVRTGDVSVHILTTIDGRPVRDDRSSVTFPRAGFFDLYEFGGQRGPRRMPTMKAILRYHGLAGVPACVRCGLVDTAIERAHIIDRSDNGLDNCANIAPLCKWCHVSQPIFLPSETAEALAWFGLPLPAGLAPFVGPVDLPPAGPLLVTLVGGGQPVSASGTSSAAG
jgi:hypothetical protein